ncbi:hypothetical protein N332_03822, partial [Mesitornis unicolor]
SGSAGVDVETAVETTLWDTSVKCIPTTAVGPSGYGLSALLLGRSSTTKKGVFVLPGVIDSDFTGQIQVMDWTPSPPVNIPNNSKIAQLVPFQSQVPNAKERSRDAGGFGSTGHPEIYLALEIGKRKPMVKMRFWDPQNPNQVYVTNMLLDTGVDVTIIS